MLPPPPPKKKKGVLFSTMCYTKNNHSLVHTEFFPPEASTCLHGDNNFCEAALATQPTTADDCLYEFHILENVSAYTHMKSIGHTHTIQTKLRTGYYVCKATYTLPCIVTPCTHAQQGLVLVSVCLNRDVRTSILAHC